MTKPLNYPIEFIRSQFPALADGFVFFDNAGGSQTLQPVVDRISEYLLTSDVQLGASYAVSQKAAERVAEANQKMAMYVGTDDPGEVVIGASATAQFRMLARCLALTWQAGDEVIITNTEHEANASPWVELEARGMVVKQWKVNPESLCLETADLEPLLTPRTRLVTFTHVSNVLGTINPVKEITDFVHQRGALIAVDGVAYAPHRALEVQQWGVDFYIFSCYKVYGPHQGVLYGKRHLLEALPSYNHYFIASNDLPYKFQPGGVNYELSYGLIGVNDYLGEVARRAEAPETTEKAAITTAFDLMAQHEAQLGQRLLAFLEAHPKTQVIGRADAHPNHRVATYSFTVAGWQSDAVVAQVDPHRIGIRYGDFYAKKLIAALGLESQNGVVRVSMVHYNTLEEVDRLIEVLEPILG
ncbi:MAG: cysteine desulfurase-like protein [Salibacteraceae bacterium]